MLIGIDLMGSDSSPLVLFQGVLNSAQLMSGSDTFCLFATKEVIGDIQNFAASIQGPSIEFIECEDEIEMEEAPLYSIRKKTKSSLVLGISYLKEKKIDAFVSSGNTGALVACSALTLAKLKGIERPALLALLPSEKGHLVVVDVGGNIACKARHLVQFAKIGAAFSRAYADVAVPQVGLLNIGVESLKGRDEFREAYDLLIRSFSEKNQSFFSFIGNVEGRDAFKGNMNVLVTDGFTGNVFLKTAEGISGYILEMYQRYIGNIEEQDASNPVKELRQHLDYEEYPGAIVTGVEGLVIKCHGNSSSRAIYNGIKGAVSLVNKDLLGQMKSFLDSID